MAFSLCRKERCKMANIIQRVKTTSGNALIDYRELENGRQIKPSILNGIFL